MTEVRLQNRLNPTLNTLTLLVKYFASVLNLIKMGLIK